MIRAIDETGKTYGYLTVLGRCENNPKRRQAVWLCKCTCGNERKYRGEWLRGGKVVSCGCKKTSDNRFKEYFDSHYTINGNGCWEWQGYRDKDGYPISCCRRIKSYRYSYERFKGEIPKGVCVCHNCPGGDNKSCVNPDHLWLGTQKENIQDKINKGRQAKGERVGNAKLKDDEVREIRILCEEGISQRKVAKKFNISQPVVSKIVLRQMWGHIT